MRDLKARVWELDPRLKVSYPHAFVTGQFADNAMLLLKTVRMIKMIVNEFDKVCKGRKLKVNFGRSKIAVTEWAREQINEFAKLHRVGAESMTLQCFIMIREDGESI